MRKLLFFLSLTMATVLIFFMTTASISAYVCGDADESGGVDIDDIVYLIAYVFQGGPEPIPLESGDVDGKEGIDIDDIVYLIDYLFTGGPAPMCNCGLLTDIDGNVYQAVLIGDQCWMKENLKVTHYRNGDPIPNLADSIVWDTLSTGACCDYGNDSGNVETYGRLYNWYAIGDSRIIAPEGWHVPTDDEWKQLEMYLGMSQSEADTNGWRGTDEGGKLKEAGTTHWKFPNTGATNKTDFSALPSGFRTLLGDFHSISTYTYFWSSTDVDTCDWWGPWARYLNYYSKQISRNDYHKRFGFSVRCVQD